MQRFSMRISEAMCSVYIPSTPRGMILLLQGFPRSVPYDQHHPGVKFFLESGFGVTVLNYPGVQDSDGAFSGAAAVSSAQETLQVLKKGSYTDIFGSEVSWPTRFLGVVGSSFGGSVGLCVANSLADFCIAISPVTDWSLPVHESDEQNLRLISKVFPHTIRLSRNWNDWSAVNPISCVSSLHKVTLVHADMDPIVPVIHSQKLAQKLGITPIIFETDEHLGLSDISNMQWQAILLDAL